MRSESIVIQLIYQLACKTQSGRYNKKKNYQWTKYHLSILRKRIYSYTIGFIFRDRGADFEIGGGGGGAH